MPRTTFIARTKLNVAGTVREPGEEVPEAASWPNLQAYLRTGQVEREIIIDPAPSTQEPGTQEPAAAQPQASSSLQAQPLTEMDF